MNATTHTAPQLRKTLLALGSIVLLAAAGPVYAAAADTAQPSAACQGGNNCGA